MTTTGAVVPASPAPRPSALPGRPKTCPDSSAVSARISPCSNASEVRASLAAFSAVPVRVCRALSLRACCSLSSLISPTCCFRKACSSAAWRVSASVSLFPAVSSRFCSSACCCRYCAAASRPVASDAFSRYSVGVSQQQLIAGRRGFNYRQLRLIIFLLYQGMKSLRVPPQNTPSTNPVIPPNNIQKLADDRNPGCR